MALDQQYITDAEFKDVYDHAGRTRAAIRGFINYLVAYEQDQQKKSNSWTLNPESFDPEPLCETTPKWHGFLMIKLAAFQANGAAYMKLRLPGNSEKIERRTSNAQHRTSNIDGFVKSRIFPFSGFPPLPSLGQALRGNDNKSINIRPIP